MIYSENTINLLEDIYTLCTPTDTRDISECNVNFSHTVSTIDEDYLTGAHFILHKVYERYYFLLNESASRERLTGKHIEKLIYNNGKKLLRNKKVNINSLILDYDNDLVDLDPAYENKCINEVYNICMNLYNKYSTSIPSTPYIDVLEDFKVNAQKDEIQAELHTYLDIFFKGKKIGKEYLSGVDVKNYIKTSLAAIEAKYDRQEQGGTSEIDSYSALRDILDNASQTYRRVTNTGIEPIDEAFSDLHATQLLTITGNPGAGKSRLASRIVYRARVLDKRNCYIWSGELGKFELIAIQLAQHCWFRYGVYIDDKMIKLYYDPDKNRKEIPEDLKLTESDIEVLKNAELDFASPTYGKLVIETDTLFVEDFEAKMLFLKKKADLDLFVIDYLLLLSSNGNNPYKRSFNKTEMLEYFMDKAKKCAKSQSMLGIVLNQLDKGSIKSILAGNNADTTASKYSSAPIDFADFNILISSNEALYAARKVKLHCPKVRSGRRYKAFIANENAGVCDYQYLQDNDDDDI